MDAVKNVMSNPVVKQGLKIVAPELVLGVNLAVDLVGPLFRKKKKTPSATKLLAVIDKELAKVLETLGTTQSRGRQRECEIRAHTLLGVLNEWEKIT